MKAKQRERKVTKSVYTSPIHTHNTHGDTTPTHGYTKPSNFTPTHRPISQFSLTKKIDTFNSFPNSICVNSHLHTHVHKITSTHIHTPIYNSHAAQSLFQGQIEEREMERGEVWIWNHSRCFRWQMVLVEALGERENVWARTNRCWVALARPIQEIQTGLPSPTKPNPFKLI